MEIPSSLDADGWTTLFGPCCVAFLFSLSSLPLLHFQLHGRISRNNQSRLHHNLTTSSNQSIDLRFCKIELAHDPRVVENARFKCHLVVLLVSSRTNSCVLPQSPAPPPYCCSEPRPDTGMMGNTTPYLHPPPRLDHSPYWDTHVDSTGWGPQANTPNMDSSSGHKIYQSALYTVRFIIMNSDVDNLEELFSSDCMLLSHYFLRITLGKGSSTVDSNIEARNVHQKDEEIYGAVSSLQIAWFGSRWIETPLNNCGQNLAKFIPIIWYCAPFEVNVLQLSIAEYVSVLLATLLEMPLLKPPGMRVEQGRLPNMQDEEAEGGKGKLCGFTLDGALLSSKGYYGMNARRKRSGQTKDSAMPLLGMERTNHGCLETQWISCDNIILMFSRKPPEVQPADSKACNKRKKSHE
ncbi:uncharacterized protein CLUP02_14794 [Colletotrichum lupini]|uniref:Uncharacterized protein n=1 Tax=Colletotrichum lupini TaxID=145971 RepID=A0A9Q8T594_9PEZI|nr:uncharacterized protein CLUP02_14794 [Colletotrichum lupini]UQC89265.1 hypothetical protein CLUP02_14794 [Colletotrichum lupini]